MNVLINKRSQTLDVITQGDDTGSQIYYTGMRLYFNPLPFISNKTVNGLIWEQGPFTNGPEYWYITLKNTKNQNLLYRYPVSYLITGTTERLPLFLLENIDTQKSYAEEIKATASGYPPNTLIGRLTFLTNYGNGNNS